MQKIYQDILQSIKEAKRIAIIPHQTPDGDALGAACALSILFQSRQISHAIYCVDRPSYHYDYLPNIERVTSDPEVMFEPFDLIIVLDSSNIVYAGVKDLLKNLDYHVSLMNIDHHKTNSDFGSINLVNQQASSTCEILYNWFTSVGLEINADLATCFLTGIITDTGNFSNAATTFESLRAASRLLIRGARFPQIINKAYKNKTISILRLWGRVLGRLQEHHGFGIASTVITLKDLEELGSEIEVTEGITNFLNNLAGPKMVLVLREVEPGKIKGSLRTTQHDIDVSLLAQRFGGGGHRRAAGFSLAGSLVRVNGGWQIH